MAIAGKDGDAQDTLTGWFAVDSITYTAGVLTHPSIDQGLLGAYSPGTIANRAEPHTRLSQCRSRSLAL